MNVTLLFDSIFILSTLMACGILIIRQILNRRRPVKPVIIHWTGRTCQDEPGEKWKDWKNVEGTITLGLDDSTTR